MSLSAFLNNSQSPLGTIPAAILTDFAADSSGNIIGINNSDSGPNIYLSPDYVVNAVAAISPEDNQGMGSTVTSITPTLIAANSNLTAGIIACRGTGGANSSDYAFLYRFTGSFSGDGSAYNYTQMPFYSLGGDVMVGPSPGSAEIISNIFSIAVSPDGNMYASYTNDNDPTLALYGVLLQYDANGSYQTSGPSGAGGDGSGAGFFMKVSDVNLNHVNQIACATGNILYCSKFNTSGAPNSSISKVSGTTVTDITDNLSTDLGATSIIGIACSSDGSILYALDSSKLYKYNPNASVGSRWSTITITDSVGLNFTQVKCDSTGTYIMVSDAGSTKSVYFSDDGGTTWQTDYPPVASGGNPDYSPLSLACPSPYRQFIFYSNGSLTSGTGMYERMSTTINTQSAAFVLTNMTGAYQMLTNADGSKIIIIVVASSNMFYSSNFGDSFTTLSQSGSTPLVISSIAASSNFSEIIVQLEDNTLNKVTLLSTTYTYTPVTYASNSDTGPSAFAIIAVSPDGLNKMAVQDNGDLSYNFWYSINNGDFVLIENVDEYTGYVSCATCTSGSMPNFYICCSDGTFDQYGYDGTNPLAYRVNRVNGFSFRSSPSAFAGVPGGTGATMSPNSISCDSTGKIIFISGSQPGDGVSLCNLNNDPGFAFATLVYMPSDNIQSISSNSSGTCLIILGIKGVYFVDNIDQTSITPPAGPVRLLSSPFITTIASNANAGRQYFFNSMSGLMSRNATAAATPCFLEGTKILCKLQNTEIYLSVQNVKIGTLVKTASGFKKVYKIGSSSIRNPGHSGRTMDRLYVCKKENFPELNEDLFITGYHSILVDELTREELDKTMKINGQVFEADNKKCLMAGVSNKTEPWAQEGTFTIWHLSLEHEDHDTKFGVFSNGLLTETCSMNYMDHDSIFNFCKRKIHIPTLTGTPTKHAFNKSSLKA